MGLAPQRLRLVFYILSLVNVKDSKASFVMELLNSLPFVKTEPIVDEKKQLTKEIKQAVKEMKLVRAGKLKARPIEDLLNEL